MKIKDYILPSQKDSIESILIDAELYVKYQIPAKALETLRRALESYPQSIELREKLREIAESHQNSGEAAEQCLALAGLYTLRGELDLASERLKEAKTLDPRVSVVAGFEAIKRAKAKSIPAEFSQDALGAEKDITLAGNIELVSIFDAVEVIENSRMTGLFVLKSEDQLATIAFNKGRIVDAQVNGLNGVEAFCKIVEIKTGWFEFSVTEEEFPEVMNVNSNKNFLLNALASLEAEKAEKAGKRDLSSEELGV